MSNQKAKEWLESLGFSCEEEPEWVIQGQKPDFFCQGPLDLWIEVKTLGPEKRFEQLGDVHVELRRRAADINAVGSGFAWAKLPMETRDAKQIMQLVDRELAKEGVNLATVKLIVMVPEEPIYSNFVRFSFETDERKTATISSVASASGKYGWPGYLEPYSYRQDLELRYSDGRIETKPLREITTFDDNVRLAVELFPSEKPFHILSTAPIGSAARVRTVERIREAVSDANSQSKNGCNYKPSPSMVIIFHDDVLVAEDEMVVAALYGDLAYTARSDNFQDGRLVFTSNGVFAPKKNTTTSAMCYVRNNARPLIVYNLWASRPLPPGSMTARSIVPSRDGSFSVIET